MRSTSAKHPYRTRAGLLVLLNLIICLLANAALADAPGSMMRLPVQKVAEPPTQYAEFCNANPGHCDMSGEPVLAYEEGLMQLIGTVHREVNAAYRLVSDWEAHNVEDLWSYPSGGVADCEDFALEKRRRLVERGLPRAALTMGIVSLRKLMSFHAVLLVETTGGTFVLDNFEENVTLWNDPQYNFYAREREDGKWDYFDQSTWTFEPTGGEVSVPNEALRFRNACKMGVR